MRDEARLAIEELQLGTKLKYYRAQVRHWTLDELSQKTGLSKPLLSQIENNLVTPPLQTLYLLSRALDVSVSELLHDLDGQRELDSWSRAETALKQMEVALAELKAAFKELKQPKKGQAKAPRGSS